MRFDSKLPDVGTTIFTVMSRRALEEGAVNVGQGFPDYPDRPALVEIATAVIAEGHNRYAPMEGAVDLRVQIAAKTRTRSRPPFRSGVGNRRNAAAPPRRCSTRFRP